MRKALFFIGISFLLIACSEQANLLENEQAPVDVNFVTPQLAEAVGTKFLLESDVVVHTKGAISENDKNVKNSFTLNDNEDKPFIHIINYEGGGFVIISGDKRLDPILAYSEKGSFNNDLPNFPGGLLDWLGYVKETVEYARTNNIELPSEMEAVWDKFSLPAAVTKVVPPLTDPCANMINEKVGPFLTTAWHQGEDYNAMMPALSCGPNGHAYVGCTPIAIAQILRYHRYPTYYQWSQMPNTYATVSTQSLMKIIHISINQTSSIDYDCGGTGVSTSYRIDNLLKDKFGYRSATQTDFNLDIVIRDLLTYNHPVILTGMRDTGGLLPFPYKGHAWVCDGAHQWETCVVDENHDMDVRMGYLRLHMNWGWADSDLNAWYAYQLGFVVDGKKYEHSLKMVYNIIP